MAKATLTLATGAVVTIEGTADEVHALLALHEGTATVGAPRNKSRQSRRNTHVNASRNGKSGATADAGEQLISIIQADQSWSKIEGRVLNRQGQVPRILLCCYFAAEHLDSPWLTARDIERVTDELGARIVTTNVSKTIREQMKRSIVTESSQGVTRFKINRRGSEAYKLPLSKEQ